MAPYSPESFSEVLRWLEDTEIEYVKNGKKGGTKSFDRYEKYSQAKTVAAALELGSRPLDLVNDFEKRILKRVGGPVRDEPLDLMSVQDTTTLTQTDLIIGGFAYQLAKKEKAGEGGNADSKTGRDNEALQQVKEALRKAKLSAKFGVKVEDMAAGVGWAESPSMVASRSRANVEAASILEAAAAEGRKITAEEVLRVLRLWAVKKNGDRKNVMPEGVTWVHSETVGLLHCSGGRLIATLHTRAYPKVLTLLCQWLKDDQEDGVAEDFHFTSIIINSGYSAKRHRDHLNVGPSCIRAFGDFEGGNLRYWQEDDKRTNIESLRSEDAKMLDVRNSTVFVDSNRAHEVEAYTGNERFSVVFFTASSFQRTADDVREQLVQIGFPFPDEEAMSRARALLPPPRGYGIAADEVKRSTPKVGRRGKKALNKELCKAKKGGFLMARMLAMRQQAQAAAAERAGGDSAAAKTQEGQQQPKEKEEKKQKRQKPKLVLANGGLFARVKAAKLAKQGLAASPWSSGPTSVKASDSSPVQLGGLSALKAGGDASPSLKRKADDATEGHEAKKPAGARPRKPLMIGGLLGRMQAKQQQQQQQQLQRQGSPEPSPASSETSTPPRKQSRNETAGAAAGGSLGLSFSSEKTRSAKKDLPEQSRSLFASRASGAKAAAAPAGATAAAPPVAKRESAAVAGGGHDFLTFIMAAGAAASSAAPAAELAKTFQAFARSGGDAEASIRHALNILVPAGPVPQGVLAAAVAEAFGEPVVPGFTGEALAAKAFGDQQRKRGVGKGPRPLSLAQVAETMAACCGGPDEVSQPVVERLAKLLGSTQVEGMEVFHLVRTLQGRSGPDREAVNAAVARALVARA